MCREPSDRRIMFWAAWTTARLASPLSRWSFASRATSYPPLSAEPLAPAVHNSGRNAQFRLLRLSCDYQILVVADDTALDRQDFEIFAPRPCDVAGLVKDVAVILTASRNGVNAGITAEIDQTARM